MEKQEDIEEELTNHFKIVHQEQHAYRRKAINEILKHILKLIMKEHNQLLLRPVTILQVEEASKQLKDGKVSGPDGFTSNFYHHFWDLIKVDVWNVVEESRVMHWLLPSLNATFITLIPKVAQPSTPEKFRPIYLCNVIYKIISKVIANRLKSLLPLLISPKQSGYVEGRQILDGIILTHETIHSLKKSKQAGMLLKIDLSKAFDKLNWTYIKSVLIAFGFSPTWVRWIMTLVSSPLCFVLVNGIPSKPYHPSMGIHKGGPLSPFLFIIMAEGLGHLIKHSAHSHLLRGLSVHGSTAVTHQQFIDENMRFGHPSVNEARTSKVLLDTFPAASGTTINTTKSQFFFFNTPITTQRIIARIISFSQAKLPSQYLGAPLIDYTLKHVSWHQLLEKMDSRL